MIIEWILLILLSLLTIGSIVCLVKISIDTDKQRIGTAEDVEKYLQYKKIRTVGIIITVICIVILIVTAIFIMRTDKTPETEVGNNVESTTAPVTDILPEPTESIPATEPATESLETDPTKPEPKPDPEPEPTEPTTKPELLDPATWVYDDNLKPEKNIFIYLTDYLGYSDAAACGIIANIAYETGWKFKPDVGDIKHGAYGLIQWMDNRRKKLKTWCDETGRDYRTIQGQMDYMDWELKNNDPYGTYECLTEVADSAKGAYKAGWYFCYWYERPNRKDKASVWRGNEAKKYYKEFVTNAE